MVGREVELDHLRRVVGGSRAGATSCTLLVGEGGVGKSRLLAEAVGVARRGGVAVAVGRAPIAATSPFGVIAEALRSWLRAHPLAPTGTAFDLGVRCVLPEWDAPAAAADLTAAQLRLLALEGVVVVLRQVVEAGRGAVIVLDDLHAADPDSVEVVRYLCAAAVPGLAIVGALRPGESAAADELVHAVRSLGGPGASVIELEPLDHRSVGALVATLLDGAPPPDLVADVLTRTDGVPLLVEEVVDAQVRAGSIQLDGGEVRWRAGSAAVPRSVRGMVEVRLERLPDRDRDVVLAGAVLGGFEPAALIAGVAAVPQGSVVPAVRAAIDAGLLVTRGGAVGFRHDVIREAVVDGAVPHAVAVMHRRAADALAGDDSLARRAGHLAAAGDADAAADLFAAAAGAEVAGHALLGAEGLARRAVGLAVEPAVRLRASDALAAVLAALGRWAESLAVDEASVAAGGDTAERLQRMASSALEAGYPQRAGAVLARADAAYPLTRLLAARVALVGGDAAAALAEADLVLGGDVDTDVDTRLTALDLRARALDFLDRRAEARASWTAQAEEAAANGRIQSQLRAVFQVGKQDFFAGQRPDLLWEAVGLARQAGALVELAWAEETLAAALALREGDPAAALDVIEAAIAQARDLGLDQLAFLVASRAGALSFTRASVEDVLAEAEAIAPAPDLLIFTRSLRADIALRHGRYDEAIAHFAAADELLRTMPGVAPSDAPCYEVWAHAALGRPTEAQAAFERAASVPDLGRWYQRPVILAAGEALLDGDPAGIDAAIARAAGPMPFAVAIMRVIGAEVLGGEVRVPWLRQALDVYEQAGATAHLERVRRLLRDAGGPVPRRRRASAAVPADLARKGVTAREAEVLRLLGEGRSNADIADSLYLSVRTVETHVSSLLAKLHVRSRGQLTALSGTVDFDG